MFFIKLLQGCSIYRVRLIGLFFRFHGAGGMGKQAVRTAGEGRGLSGSKAQGQ